MNEVGFTLVYSESDSFYVVHFDSEKELTDFLLSNSMDPDTCVAFKGRPELMGVRSGFTLQPLDYDIIEDSDEGASQDHTLPVRTPGDRMPGY